MKAYKVLALLKRVEKLNAGDKRILINGFPCKVDFRMIADDLFEDAVYALQETIEELEQVKNRSIPDVVGRSEQYHCELFAFGRQDKRCFKQCEGCEWMEGKQ